MPVENRVIANDVTMRADILYDEAVEVKIETGEISGAAVVTGKLPEVGAEVAAASVFLEIAGRPVIALPGELPAYRSLRVGVSGPDVLQLKQALASLGIDPGSVESDLYDARTAAAVDQLYVMAGYPSAVSGSTGSGSVPSARDQCASQRSGWRAIRTQTAGPVGDLLLELPGERQAAGGLRLAVEDAQVDAAAVDGGDDLVAGLALDPGERADVGGGTTAHRRPYGVADLGPVAVDQHAGRYGGVGGGLTRPSLVAAPAAFPRHGRGRR